MRSIVITITVLAILTICACSLALKNAKIERPETKVEVEELSTVVGN